MTEVQTIALRYPTIINAKQTYDRVAPVLEQLLKFRDEGISFTPAMVGEALMGDAYHQTHEHELWNGDIRKLRSSEAYSMSSTIGHALHILRKIGMVTYETKKDMEHPHTFEDETCGYCLNDAPIPDVVCVHINGSWIEVEARNIEGVKRKWTKKQVTRYPSVDWYTFK